MKNLTKIFFCFLFLSVISKKSSAQMEAKHLQLAVIANIGSSDSIGHFEEESYKLWKSYMNGKTLSYEELNRDQFSVYLREYESNDYVIIDIWQNAVTVAGVKKYTVIKKSDNVIPEIVDQNVRVPDNTPPVNNNINNSIEIGKYIDNLNYTPALLLSVQENGSKSSLAVPESSIRIANVAKGKSTRQSSNFEDGYLSELAVDGNTNTNWSGRSMAHTAEEDGAWWEVDLGSAYEISSIKVFGRTDCCQDRLKGFNIRIGNTSFNTNSDGVLFAANQPNPTSASGISVNGNVTGRYVRIYLSGKNLLGLAEVEVYGKRKADIIDNGIKERKPNPAGSGIVICTKKVRDIDKNMNNITILNPTSGTIYPGAMILADRKLAEGLPTPVTLKKSPITLAYTLKGSAEGTKISIPDPKNSSVTGAVNKLLDDWFRNNRGNSNDATLHFDVSKVFSSEQFALDMGFRLDWADNYASGALKVNTNSESDVTIAFYKQAFYTIAVDAPEKPSDMFDPSVTLTDVQRVMTNDHPPAYVKSVDYGRIIMVRMETNKRSVSLELEAALKYAIDPTTRIEAELKSKYENILRNSRFTVYVLGGNAQSGGAVAVGGNDLTALKTAIEKDAVIRTDNRGVPIAYTVSFLKDNTVANIYSTSKYIETECIEYPSGYIKLTHAGAYVGRFRVTWQQQNEEGILVSYSKNSGEKTAGYTETIPIPGDAENINIIGEAATGVAWDPWQEVINIVLRSPTNCTYTIYGTTLDRKYSVSDCPDK